MDLMQRPPFELVPSAPAILFDAAVLVGLHADGSESGPSTLAPDAGTAIRHLAETGHRPIVVGDVALAGRATREAATPVGYVDDIPADATGWLLVGDPHRCEVRHPAIRTMLVGPRRAATTPPVRRCDAEARDLADAVLGILAHEAMPGP